MVIDPLIGIGKVIRPFPNFEATYEQVDGTTPIAFPGTLDPRAGQTGYDANLMAGFPVPLGSRVKIWIPQTLDSYTPELDYEYQFVWRIRTQKDYSEDVNSGRHPYTSFHLPAQEIGRKTNSSARYFLPGASDVVLYEPTQPASGLPASLVAVSQRYRPQVTSPVAPLTPSGLEGYWQQGAYEDSDHSEPGGPSYSIFELDCQGDELAVYAYKIDTATPWTFGGADQAFSNTYGTNNGARADNPNLGILLFVGSGAP